MVGVQRESATAIALLMLCLVSAIAVVYSSHSCRRFYSALQDLEIERWRAQAHYSRLLLEQSTLASPHRVLVIAKDQLGMSTPSIGTIRVVLE